MSQRYYSVGEVAERLGLHVRTVRGYVRDGKLPAVRIGKQYRITDDALREFTGGPVPGTPRETAGRVRRVEASSIVEIDAVDPQTAHRLATMLTAVRGRGADDRPVHVQTVYDAERAWLKVVVLGGLADTAAIFTSIETVLAEEGLSP